MKETLYLNSINYQRAQQLQEQVGGNSALYRVLDAIIFCWQNSNYQEEGKKIACPKLARLAELASMSLSSVKRQIKKLKELGFIGTKIKKVFNGSTRCFFWVYDIVFDLLGKTNKKEATASPQVNSGAEWLKLSHSTSSNWATPIYIVKNNKEKKNNNYSIKQSVNLSAQPNDAVDVNFQQVEKEVNVHCQDTVVIGEKLTRQQCAIINGMVNNLIKEGVKVTNPKELKAQVAFKAEQKNMQSGGDNLKHQVNAAAKLIRSGKWTTPFGFYKYSAYGIKQAKQKEEANLQHKALKQSEKQASGLVEQIRHRFNLSCAENVLDSNKNTNQTEGARHDNENENMEGITNTNESRFDILKNTIDKYHQRMKILPEEGRVALQGVVDRLYSEMQILMAGKV